MGDAGLFVEAMLRVMMPSGRDLSAIRLLFQQRFAVPAFCCTSVLLNLRFYADSCPTPPATKPINAASARQCRGCGR
jgi:hypothetical protein